MEIGSERGAALLGCLLLLLSLAACGGGGSSGPGTAGEDPLRSAYDEGYRAGYDAARADQAQSAWDEGYRAGYADGQSSVPSPPGGGVPPEEGTPAASSLPEGFVLVSEAVPDVILEIRYYSTYNFVGERIDGYEAPVAILTEEAAAALKAVSDDLLQQGYRLKIYDAYRPQTAVDQFESWSLDMDDTRMEAYFYPELDKSVLFQQGYIASRSGHSRGSTVDLTLFDMASGKDVDMGGAFDWFGPLSHYGQTEGLTEEQIANRQLLRAVMAAHGFRGISTEWWHFTLEDEPYPDTYFDFPVSGG